MDNQKIEIVNAFSFQTFCKENAAYVIKALKKKVFKPYLKIFCMRAIIFYQKHLSKHDCKFNPSCSQYTLECINNKGVIIGIALGIWRIIRCHPLSKGGYDPAPEKFFQKRWLL